MAITDPVEWRLYDTDFTTDLGILPSDGGNLYFELNEPGSGEIKIPLSSSLASVVTSGMFARCFYRGQARGGFLVDNISKVNADGAEGGGQWLSLSGRGALAIMDEAIVWDDGTGNTKREFTGTKAGMLITLIDEAVARGAIANVIYDFSAVNDSESTPWTDSEQLSFPVGTSLLDVLRQFANTGIDFNMLINTDGTFTLQAFFNKLGSNKFDTVYFRVGSNCEEVREERRGTKIKNVLKMKWRDGFATVTDGTSITAYRRREDGLSIESAQSSASATTYGAAKLDGMKDPERSLPIKVYDGVTPYVFENYSLGDYITIDRFGVEQAERIHGMQLSFNDAGYASIVITLNDTILDNELAMSRNLDWLMNQWNTARDANQMETTFWAAIGDPNITYDIVDFTISGSNLYAINSDGVLLKYNIDEGGWTHLADIPTTSMKAIEVIGSNVYIAAGTRIYKYNGSTLTLYCSFYYLDLPSITFIASMEAIGTNLYIHGNFDDAYITVDVPITGVAVVNTVANTVSDIGGDFGLYDTMTTDGTNLYMMSGDAKQAMQWSGSAWSDIGTPFTNAIYTLEVYNDQLLAGGVDGIFVWDGATWAAFQGNVSGVVRAITTYLTDVYVGGDFTAPASHIAKFSGGEWYDLAGGVNDVVRRLGFYNQDLYVSGDFTTAGDKTAQGVAAYFNNFESLANYLENSESTFNMAEAIHNAPEKHPLVAADEFGFWDSVSKQLRKIAWSNVLATIKTYTDTLYVALTGNQTVAGVKTFSSTPLVPDDAYDATTWNGSTQVPTKNAVRDKIESLGSTSPGGADTNIQYNNAGAFGGSSDLVRNSDGSISIGGTPPVATTAYGLFQKADAVSVTNILASFGSSVASFITGIRARGTYASQTAALLDDVMLRLRGRAHDGSTIGNTSAEVRLLLSENHTSSAHGTNIELHATPTGSTTLTKIFTALGSGHVNIESGKEYRVNGAQHTHLSADVTDLTSIPLLTSDPVSPTDGELWLLRETVGAIADGNAMGMMAFTYTGNTGTVQPLQLSVNDNGTTRRIAFV